MPPPPPQAGPVPVRTRSRLGRFTLSLGLLALGVLAIVDIAGARVPFTAYPGALLAVVGSGLLIGAWFGRARWLIPIGVALTLMLAIGSGPHYQGNLRSSGDLTVTPTTVAGIGRDYHRNFGDFTLDLRNVDFSGVTEPKDVDITMNAGNLTILVPPRVDTTVHAMLDLGDAKVFGTQWGGIGVPARDVVDDDGDGPGGGALRFNIQLNAGNLEVHR
jgi:hypothetical protein